MPPRLNYLLLNLTYAGGYFAGGYLGMLLASPPSNASPVWPAAGVALAGVLLYGARLFPGVFLGAMAAQIYSFLDTSTADSVDASILVASIIAVGSCLQAYFGAALIKRFVGEHDPLVEDKKILSFLLLGGPLSCTVSATLGIVMLHARQVVANDDLWISWGTWWVGDTIGVLIFTPLTLLFIGKPDNFWKPRRRYITFPLLILLLTVFAVFKYSQKQEEERVTDAFQRQVFRLHSALKNEIKDHLVVNETLKAFFDSSESVSHPMFHQFSRPLIARLKGVRALQWIPRVEDSERRLLERREKIEFSELDAENKVVPAAHRDAYFPIVYAEPDQGNEDDIGLDLSSRPGMLDLVRRIIDSGQITAIYDGNPLISRNGRRCDVFLYTPLYRKDAPLATVEQRRESFKGLVASVFRVESIVTNATAHAADVQLTLAIVDGDKKLYDSQENERDLQILYHELEQTSTVNFGQRHWQVTFRPSHRFYAGQQSWTTWWLLLGGLILTSLIGLGLMLLTGRAARVEELVRIKTGDLEEANRHLNREIAKRQKLQIEQSSRNRVLEQLAQGDPLESILHRIALDAEKLQTGMACSILLYDPDKQCLCSGASPGLPEFFVEAIDGMVVREGTGACGTAAFRKETVVIEDVRSHPFCRDFRGLFARTELKAVWSEPIVSSRNALLGTFAIYYRKPCSPTREDIKYIKRMAQLTAIAIEQKNNESELRIAAKTFQSHEAIMVTDRDGTILRVNEAFTKITGYSESEAVGQNPRIMSSNRQNFGFYRQMVKTLRSHGRWQGEIWNRRKNGEIFPEWLMVTAVKNDLDDVTHYVAIFSDITEKKAAEKEIHDLAFYDPLTGLPNRRLLLDRLQHEIATAKRHRRYGALFFLDLDHFKRLNDSLGHQVGDELLVQVSKRINALLREEDTACRLGGDEFIVLVSGQGDNLEQATDHAALLAEKIRDVINQPFMLGGSLHHFTTSIGVSIYPDLSEQPETVIQQADTAMYRAKESGRNGISFFRPSMQKLADQRLILEKEMREALRDGHFLLLYQPQVDRNGHVVSVEALIRWLHPEKGMIKPASFISVAEDTQLILPIGQWVLQEACRQISRWDSENRRIGHVAVNVSSRQFRQPDFVEQIEIVLAETGIAASRLTIELTEGIVIDNIDDTVKKMQALKRMGVGISIDDFGTGYSSLSYLKQLPLGQLKIDQNFVRDIVSDPNDAVIVETIINMAKNLGLNVIAEGVETQAQMDFLLAKGCVHFQGYFFGRPVAADQLAFPGAVQP